MLLNITVVQQFRKFLKTVVSAHCTIKGCVLQEDAGVNHIAAKIIDSISAKPGPHAAVCVHVCPCRVNHVFSC